MDRIVKPTTENKQRVAGTIKELVKELNVAIAEAVEIGMEVDIKIKKNEVSLSDEGDGLTVTVSERTIH